MRKIRLLILIILSLNVTNLFASTYSLNPGWNLIGTMVDIPVSEILANTNVKNVVIFQDGIYKASNKNEFTTVPAKSGFFIFSESTTLVISSDVDTSVQLAKVDGNGAELPSYVDSWDILHIKDANLYVEMKNDLTVEQLYPLVPVAVEGDLGETVYCNNLVVGTTSGWRLPTATEFTGIASIYRSNQEYFTTVSTGLYWTSTPYIDAFYYSSFNSGSLGIRSGSTYLRVTCVKDAP